LKDKTKTIEIDGHRYQIRRFMPDIGSFILMQVIGAGIKSGQSQASEPDKEVSETPDAETIVRTLIFGAFFGNSLNCDAFGFVQKQCMRICSRMEGTETSELPMPIVNDSGQWAIMDVRDDLALVIKLSVECMVFNFSDFFAEGGLGAMAGTPAQKL